MKMNNVLFSTGKDDWETPQDFFLKMDNEFHFTLDACANDLNHKCPLYFNEETDGLKQDWSGHVVWVNPPYSQKVQDKWVKKCFEESKKSVVVMLIPARTDTKRFHKYIYNQPGVEIRFIEGRLKFVGAENHAPFPSMVVIFNRKDDKNE